MEWYKSYYSGKPMMPITVYHIDAYEDGIEGRS